MRPAHQDDSMARPLDPRSRAQACRLTGVHEATVRRLERQGLLSPVSEWTAIDLVWARVLTTPGLRPGALPPRPDTIGPEDVLIVPILGPEAGEITPSMLQAMGLVDRLRENPVAVLQIGRWFTSLQESWT